MTALSREFYEREDVVQIARDLLGKHLITQFSGSLTSGIITETEAYAGAIDRASHAYGNRRTKRTEIMFGPAGFAYVYLCYGIHHLFNVVTNKPETPHAVLVRAIQPDEGLETMLARRNKPRADKTLSGGPGTLSQALGITTSHTGTSLNGPLIRIEDRGVKVPQAAITAGPRIGVDYAGEDALLPYRFVAQLSA